jgi:amidophosphoribosyltransferase
MSTKEQLIGSNKTAEEICKEIGADSLYYFPLDCLCSSCGGSEKDFCCACFNGDYPIDATQFNNGEFVLKYNK